VKILLVKLSSLGDVVHTLPVVQDIHAAMPDAQIDWVVEKSFAPLLSFFVDDHRLNRTINRVITCEIRRWRKSPFSSATRSEWRAFKAALQAESYDAVIDLQGLTKSAVVSWLARLTPNGKRYALANQTEGSGYEATTRWVADVAFHIKPHIHALKRSRELAALALGYRLDLTPDFGLKKAVDQQIRTRPTIENIAIPVTEKTLAFIHGTSRADKQWPLSHWQELGQRLIGAGYHIALAHGNAAEHATSQAIAQAISLGSSGQGSVTVWPMLPLDALTAALAQCVGVIGVDSGVSHIAVALGLPHVQIYNFDTAWRTGPDERNVVNQSTRQVSVFATPAPSFQAVWQAWLGVFGVRAQIRRAFGSPVRRSACTAAKLVSDTNNPRLILNLYSLLLWLAQPFMRRKLARRARQEPGYGEAIAERFGSYTQPPEVKSELLWLHAVSLGETRTAAILIKALREQYPALRILLTHGTATGCAEGAGLLRAGDVQVWQPWDSKGAVQRFFNHFKPRIGLLMETEIWPNLVAGAQARAVPLVLVNARLSEKSLQQALALAPLAYPAYGALSAVYAQTDEDAKRFRQLGAPVAGVFGNLKFDATPDAASQATGKAWRQAIRRPVVMFASSREGEEDDFYAQISATSQQIRTEMTNFVATDLRASAGLIMPHILVVPRHPQRFDEVAALAEKHGLQVSRRSTWPAGPASNEEAMAADIWLGDTLGQMALYYSLADAALLGGSFAPLGGQNLIEAAACGCPVIMGPHTFNFAEAAQNAEVVGAARRVADMAGGVRMAMELVSDAASAKAQAVASGLAFAARNRGATVKTLDALRGWLQ